MIFEVTSVSEQIIIIITIIITIIIFTEDLRSHIKARSESSGGAVVTALASHQCGSGSISKPELLCGLSLLVLFSALRGFGLGRFSPFLKNLRVIKFSSYSVPS